LDVCQLRLQGVDVGLTRSGLRFTLGPLVFLRGLNDELQGLV